MMAMVAVVTRAGAMVASAGVTMTRLGSVVRPCEPGRGRRRRDETGDDDQPLGGAEEWCACGQDEAIVARRPEG